MPEEMKLLAATQSFISTTKCPDISVCPHVFENVKLKCALKLVVTLDSDDLRRQLDFLVITFRPTWAGVVPV